MCDGDGDGDGNPIKAMVRDFNGNEDGGGDESGIMIYCFIGVSKRLRFV